MTIYICKTCGRAMRANVKPTYCYADRMDHLENISDEDSLRMFLFSNCDSLMIDDIEIEFPGDYRFNPMSGVDLSPPENNTIHEKPWTLDEFQIQLMIKGIYCNV
jgi:hypothetical protein